MESDAQETPREQSVSDTEPPNSLSSVSPNSYAVPSEKDIVKPEASGDTALLQAANVGTHDNKETHQLPINNYLDKMSGEVKELSDHLGQLKTNDPLSAVTSSPSRHSTYEIDADMMQIDSILKALNSGKFDQGDMMTIDHLTSKKPRNVVSAVQIAPSTGLNLIGQMYSDNEDSSSSSDSEASSGEESFGGEQENKNEICDSDDSESKQKKPETRKYGYPMVKGEVDYRDLPPDDVSTLQCPSDTTLANVGKVLNTTEKLIIIESVSGENPLDEGTILWNSRRQAIGKLFETFGPVKKPFYSIRAGLMPVSVGEDVFAVLGNEELTKFAFMKNILDQKGSDASWQNDEEVPEEYQDFSDDEKERLASKEKSYKRSAQHQSSCPGTGSRNKNVSHTQSSCPSRPTYTRSRPSRPRPPFVPHYCPPTLPPQIPPFPPPFPPPHLLPSPTPPPPVPPFFPPARIPGPPIQNQCYPDAQTFSNDFVFPNTSYPPPSFNTNHYNGTSSAIMFTHDRTMWQDS